MEELYFKDSFSQNEDGINLEINNLSATCITSNNDNFSLDSEGNLIVKSIQTVEEANIDYQSVFYLVYPIGSVYISVSATNPNILFGGAWEAFATGRTLVGIDTSQTEFNSVEKTGGHKALQTHSHTGSTNSAGGHTHNIRALSGSTSGAGSCLESFGSGAPNTRIISAAALASGDHSHAITINNAGTGNSGNLQPYITCYMWKRTA